MLLDTIQAELARLQIHPVNLSVTTKDDRCVALRGSLLRYWNLPETVEATWFLDVLQNLPDVAGPAVVMNALGVAHASECRRAQASEIATAPAHVDAAASDQTACGGEERRK